MKIDNSIKPADYSSLFKSLILLVSAFLLAGFLVAILTDGILNYKTGFWIVLPLILFLLFFLINNIFKFAWKSHANIWMTLLFIALNAVNSLLMFFNIFMWMDLFDGKITSLLP